jgi:hypothetical protein
MPIRKKFGIEEILLADTKQLKTSKKRPSKTSQTEK